MTITPPNTGRRPRRLFLILPFVIFGVIFAAYSALWVYGAGVMEKEIANYIEDEAKEGRSIDYEGLTVRGYPFTLRARLENFIWTDDTLWRWSGEELHIVTLPYDARRLIFMPRGQQTYQYNGTSFDITADDLRIGLEDGKYSAETHGFMATAPDQSLTLSDLRLNIIEGEDESWVLGAELRNIRYQDDQERIGHTPFFNIAARYSPLTPDRAEIGSLIFSLSDVEVTTATRLELSGDVGIDEAGYPDGAFTLKLRNQRAMLSLIERFDLLPPTEVTQLTMSLNALSNNGTAEVTLPFQLRDGRIYMTFLQLGELPKIR